MAPLRPAEFVMCRIAQIPGDRGIKEVTRSTREEAMKQLLTAGLEAMRRDPATALRAILQARMTQSRRFVLALTFLFLDYSWRITITILLVIMTTRNIG